MVITWPCTIAAGSPSGWCGEDVAAEVAGQHDDGVAEIHRAPLPVRQPPVVEHLQQNVEDVLVRLLHLVEQDHLVWPAAHRLGQHAALIIADVTRRRADQAGDGCASP